MGWTVGLLIRGYIDEGGPYGMGLNCRAFASELQRLRLWSSESRADHGLENFRDSL